jgi:hypothetical protein
MSADSPRSIGHLVGTTAKSADLHAPGLPQWSIEAVNRIGIHVESRDASQPAGASTLRTLSAADTFSDCTARCSRQSSIHVRRFSIGDGSKATPAHRLSGIDAAVGSTLDRAERLPVSSSSRSAAERSTMHRGIVPDQVFARFH